MDQSNPAVFQLKNQVLSYRQFLTPRNQPRACKSCMNPHHESKIDVDDHISMKTLTD